MTTSTVQQSESKTILVAEDHALFSEGIKLVLESSKSQFNVMQASNGKLALEVIAEKKPDLILMDIAMPDMDGLEASAIIKKEYPDIKIIMLTSFADEQSLRSALGSGVEAYCSKDINFRRLLGVIDMVLNGGFYLDPAVAHYVIKLHAASQPASAVLPQAPQITGEISSLNAITNERATSLNLVTKLETPLIIAGVHTVTTDRQKAEKRYEIPADNDRPVVKMDIPKPQPIKTDRLSARELELLSLIADYRNNEEIARLMGISEAWVNGYIKDIIFKLAVNNEVEAVRRAVEEGVISNAKILDQDNL